MGEVVDIARYASARDRKLLVEIVESAQLAQAFAAYERSFFMSSPADQRKIAERLATMAAAAAKLSGAVRERTVQVPWSALIEAGGAARKPDAEPAALWTAVKKVVPRVTSALAPLVQGSAGVFAWTPPPKIRRDAKTTSSARSRRKGGAERPRGKR
jgi:uncharacterized protein with HEPN domain